MVPPSGAFRSLLGVTVGLLWAGLLWAGLAFVRGDWIMYNTLILVILYTNMQKVSRLDSLQANTHINVDCRLGKLCVKNLRSIYRVDVISALC